MKDLSTEQLLLLEMKISGMIKGDDEMEWYSPNNEFRFVINRYENTLITNDTDGHYIIIVQIFNMIGIKITELRFSEIDAIRILDAINEFLYEFNGGHGEEMVIYINPNNLRLENKMIRLYRTNAIVSDEDFERGIPSRDIQFTIEQYSSYHQNLIQMMCINIANEELEQLAFEIFYHTLIDIELPYKLDNKLESIVEDMYIEKFHLFEDEC